MDNILGSKIGEDYLAVNTILLQFIILASFFRCLCFSTEGIVGFTIGRRNQKSFNSCQKFNSSKFYHSINNFNNLHDFL